MNWICKIFGHKFDLIDKIMFEIKLSALNPTHIEKALTCKRCKHKLIES